MTVETGSWTVTRDYPHPPGRVFAAWADPAIKVRWFDPPDDDASGPAVSTYRSDFRVGGRETAGTRPGLRPRWTYEAEYRDIVPDERIVTTYEMAVDGRRVSVSVSTATFASTATGTRLTYVEQGVFLDGLDSPDSRRGGDTAALDRLGAVLDDTSRGTTNAP